MKIRSQQIRRRNNMLAELAELVVGSLKRHGIPMDKATAEAEELAFQLHRRWAGITFAFPAKDDLARKRLEAHIMERYDGTNADELVREFGVTESFIYAVMRKYQRQKVDKNQLKMDLGDPAD